MAVNTDPILDSFISVAQTVLAGLISESGPSGGPTTPSVIKARKKGPRPDFPYVQIDLMNVADTSGYLLATSVDEDFNVAYDTHKKVRLQYIVYGGNATSIAETLATAFRRDVILMKVAGETGGELEQAFDVQMIPGTLSTQKYDIATFDLIFNINDRYIDTEIGVFDEISLTGDLQYEGGDESLPIEIYVSGDPAFPKTLWTRYGTLKCAGKLYCEEKIPC